jgi:hypothetical protein
MILNSDRNFGELEQDLAGVFEAVQPIGIYRFV